MGYTHKYDFSKESDRWRATAAYFLISDTAKVRLEWMIFHHTVAKQNASYTASHFGISRKTLHAWIKRFNPARMQSLESVSCRPHRLRKWQVTPLEEERITKLRGKHMVWGKKKLQVRYQAEYGDSISTWKIERVIRKHRLYPDPILHTKQVQKRQRSRGKVRIHTLDTAQFPAGTLWHVDTVIIDWYGTRRSILTAIEDKTKLGYAKVYQRHTSQSAADFLKRLIYLSDSSIAIIHSDNGSEFAGEFERAIADHHLSQVYSRVRWP